MYFKNKKNYLLVDCLAHSVELHITVFTLLGGGGRSSLVNLKIKRELGDNA